MKQKESLQILSDINETSRTIQRELNILFTDVSENVRLQISNIVSENASKLGDKILKLQILSDINTAR